MHILPLGNRRDPPPAARMSRRRWALSFCCLAACRGRARRLRIADIDSREVHDRVCLVRGEVTSSLSLMGYAVFVVNDGTGSLPVITSLGAPRKGKTVDVRGRIFVMADSSESEGGPLIAMIEDGSEGAVDRLKDRIGEILKSIS